MKVYDIVALGLALFGSVYTILNSLIQSGVDIYKNNIDEIKETRDSLEKFSQFDSFKDDFSSAYKKLEANKQRLYYVKYIVLALFGLIVYSLVFLTPWMPKTTQQCYLVTCHYFICCYGLISLILLLCAFGYFNGIKKQINEIAKVQKRHEEEKSKQDTANIDY